MELPKQPDNISYILIVLLLTLTTIAGFFAYKSIDFEVLDRLEKQPLNIPPPPATNSANIKISTESAK